MNKLQFLIGKCMKENKTPESYWNVRPDDGITPLPAHILHGSEAHYVNQAKLTRFPDVLRTLICLRGMAGSDLAADLYRDITMDIGSNIPTIKDLHNFVLLNLVGISLSWWLFGLGQPMAQPFFLDSLDPGKKLNDYIRNLNYKQGWSDLEGKWFLTQTHESTEKKTIHRVMIRLMSGLPKMQFFPPMPPVVDVYKRLERVIQSFVLPKRCPEWMAKTVTILRTSGWKTCILMLVRQASISHWHLIGQVPRRKSSRLAFAISLLFDLYGEQQGMEYYLTVLNLEAQAQGFEDLSEVAESAVWKINNSVLSPED